MSSSGGPPAEFRPALLVVDVQEDFCPPDGALAVPDGRAIIPVVNDLLALPFKLKVATKDHHPPNHVSFACTHGPPAQFAPFTSYVAIQNPANPAEAYASRLWPVHCVAGTPGNALTAGLAANALHRVVLKGSDPRVEMYSAVRAPLFDPPLASAVSELPELLRASSVTDVFVVGLAGDYCVKASAEDLAGDGWRVWVVEEGVRSVGGEKGWREAAEDMKMKGVGIVSAGGEEVGWVKQLAAAT